MIYCTSVFEDEPTHQVMLRLYSYFTDCFFEQKSIPCNGNGKIKRQIGAYNNAAKYNYYFIIADLDNSYECAPSLIKDWIPGQHASKFLFRVAVHEIESWLLADRVNFASFLSLSQALLPLFPDNEPDPKQIVINLAKKSRKREIREGIVPIDDYAKIGPGYNSLLQKFIQNTWDVDFARKNSSSLDKTIKSLERIAFNNKNEKIG